MDGQPVGPFQRAPAARAKLAREPAAPAVPQFETAPAHAPAQTLRARSAEDAVRQSAGLADEADVGLGEAEPGTAWQSVTVDGAPWGRVRAHSRMRFRRD